MTNHQAGVVPKKPAYLIDFTDLLLNDLTIEKERPIKDVKNDNYADRQKKLGKVIILPKYTNLSKLTLPITLSTDGTIF